MKDTEIRFGHLQVHFAGVCKRDVRGRGGKEEGSRATGHTWPALAICLNFFNLSDHLVALVENYTPGTSRIHSPETEPGLEMCWLAVVLRQVWEMLLIALHSPGFLVPSGPFVHAL